MSSYCIQLIQWLDIDENIRQYLIDEFLNITSDFSNEDNESLILINSKYMSNRSCFIQDIANFRSMSGRHGIEFIKILFNKLKQYKESNFSCNQVYNEIEMAINNFETKVREF